MDASPLLDDKTKLWTWDAIRKDVICAKTGASLNVILNTPCPFIDGQKRIFYNQVQHPQFECQTLDITALQLT
jgi:hypothetical protein